MPAFYAPKLFGTKAAAFWHPLAGLPPRWRLIILEMNYYGPIMNLNCYSWVVLSEKADLVRPCDPPQSTPPLDVCSLQAAKTIMMGCVGTLTSTKAKEPDSVGWQPP